jgi:hypothetical protein
MPLFRDRNGLGTALVLGCEMLQVEHVDGARDPLHNICGHFSCVALPVDLLTEWPAGREPVSLAVKRIAAALVLRLR